MKRRVANSVVDRLTAVSFPIISVQLIMTLPSVHHRSCYKRFVHVLRHLSIYIYR